MIGKRFRSLPFIFANDNYTLSPLTTSKVTPVLCLKLCIKNGINISLNLCNQILLQVHTLFEQGHKLIFSTEIIKPASIFDTLQVY